MIHVRTDDQSLNSKRTFACGIGPELPHGDVYYFQSEWRAERADCPGCNPAGPRPLGVSCDELSGRVGDDGFRKFARIARDWGYP